MQDKQNKQFAAKIELTLDAYLGEETDETFFDISCKQHPSPNKKYCMMYAKKQNYISLIIKRCEKNKMKTTKI